MEQVIVNECWRSIDGYINYQVSNIGRVQECKHREDAEANFELWVL
jgi:hypothetical protein